MQTKLRSLGYTLAALAALSLSACASGKKDRERAEAENREQTQTSQNIEAPEQETASNIGTEQSSDRSSDPSFGQGSQEFAQGDSLGQFDVEPADAASDQNSFEQAGRAGQPSIETRVQSSGDGCNCACQAFPAS